VSLVIFAWGNPSRGDDAVGPWFADHLRPLMGKGLKLVEDFQLQVEHLLDCQQGQLLLFIDARCDGGEDFRFEQVTPCHDLAHTSHALAPTELLGQYARVFKEQPPPAFQLTVPGNDFELGSAMSASTAACCRRAARWLQPLLVEPDLVAWRRSGTTTNTHPPCSTGRVVEQEN